MNVWYNCVKEFVRMIYMTLEELRMYAYLKRENEELAMQIKNVYNLTYETINNISHSYGNFTMHDMNHGLRVANYMEMLAFGIDDKVDNRMSKFSYLEIALMILSSILHDIGMTIRSEDRANIKNNIIKYATDLTYEGVVSSFNGDEDEAIKEIIRRTHADRITDFIDYDFDGKKISDVLTIDGNYSYAVDVAEICRAHGLNHSELKNIRTERTKGCYTYNSQYIAALLRIADYLDIDKQRTPMLWYSVMNIDGFSKEEWETHFIIENNVKIKDYMDGKTQIFFDGVSRDPKIHRKYLGYIDKLKVELENTDMLLNQKDTAEKYRFNICTKIDDRVKTEGFTYSNLKLNLDYSSITDLLMGENIYGNKKLGLRELIQNSIDACKIMNEVKGGLGNYFMSEPSIYVIVSKNNNYVKIKDTGIGMSLDVIKKHFLNVGKSYYKSSEYLFKNYDYKPIGQYGIGFLACFLLSNSVVVKTKYYKNHEINQIELERSSEYVVTTLEETTNFFGTEITLDYSGFFEVFETKENLIEFLQQYFYTNVPITLVDEDENDTIYIKNKYKNADYDYSGLKYKYDPVEVYDSSNILEGKVYLKTKKRNPKIAISNIEFEYTYLYDKNTHSFTSLSKKQLEQGFYRIISYGRISEELYNEIKTKEKNKSRMCKAVISMCRSENKHMYLLIKNNEFLDLFYPHNFNKGEIQTALKNSNLPYFEELMFEYDLRKFVFINNEKYIEINCCLLNSDWRYDFYDEDDENKDLHSFYFYNKGVLIPKFDSGLLFSPYKIGGIYGYVNCDKLPIKLDVSRNRVIDGANSFQRELNIAILKNQLDKENSDEITNFIECLIDYIKKSDDSIY